VFNYEIDPVWDKDKERIIGSEADSFDINAKIDGSLPYDWWYLKKYNEVIGYGWLNVNEDDVEISISISKEHRNKGLGTKTLHHLEQQILSRNLPKNIVVTVYGTNIHRFKVAKMLKSNGYRTCKFPIKDAAEILKRGEDVTFFKTLK